MKLLFSQINEHQVISYDSLLESYFDNENKVIKEIKKASGEITFDPVKHILITKCNIDFDLVLYSSYTNEPFEKTIHISDDIYFTNKKELENDENIYVKDEIDLDHIIYSLLITSIPLNIHKKGEKLPSGDGYRVISEEELIKEKMKEEPGNQFDILKGIDFDK